ncbi:MAG TPA: asparagine synthase (glutamine-hydrolyzing), partial [Flavisolibacter sp.]|nr:asparagine synthase (glutamine-hydrolyzing) [Flavisolibacter sp.]
MCGIAGIVSGAPVEAERVKAATASLIHRGPQSNGFYFNEEGTTALGHRRLCIIDLSSAANQPMLYAGRYTIVYNGELYNYIELRATLLQRGFSFTSQSDTEVVVASYAAYGKECLKDFDGAFAFAIWDNQDQTLFAARDRLGEKPFFYAFDGEELVFASEMKALWKAGIKQEVNARMMYNFLTIGYTSNPYEPAETFYEGVYRLPAASHLTYTLKTKQATVEKYWQVAIHLNEKISETEAIETFTYLFNDSIKKRLRSDVGIGTSLSGGLDSSAIVAFCEKNGNSQYTHQCFTAAFAGYEKDELLYARLVANRFGLAHTIVETNGNDIVRLMSEVMQYQEDPILSASALVQYKVYEAANQNGVTVLLDGQGADEILAGYHKYYKWYWQELYRRNKLTASTEVSTAKAIGIQESFGLTSRTAALFPQLAAALQQSKKKKEAFQSTDLNRDFAFSNKEHLYYSLPVNADLNSALYFNTFNYGLEELLRLADRNSMAHSVEVRLPFLSHELVGFLFTLPPHFKINGGWSKWLLRKTVEPMLPKEIVWRRDKTGFEPPQMAWMENKEVQAA